MLGALLNSPTYSDAFFDTRMKGNGKRKSPQKWRKMISINTITLQQIGVLFIPLMNISKHFPISMVTRTCRSFQIFRQFALLFCQTLVLYLVMTAIFSFTLWQKRTQVATTKENDRADLFHNPSSANQLDYSWQSGGVINV